MGVNCSQVRGLAIAALVGLVSLRGHARRSDGDGVDVAHTAEPDDDDDIDLDLDDDAFDDDEVAVEAHGDGPAGAAIVAVVARGAERTLRHGVGWGSALRSLATVERALTRAAAPSPVLWLPAPPRRARLLPPPPLPRAAAPPPSAAAVAVARADGLVAHGDETLRRRCTALERFAVRRAAPPRRRGDGDRSGDAGDDAAARAAVVDVLADEALVCSCVC